MDSITSLPLELIRTITGLLDTTSLCRLTRVCKSLNTICEPLLWRKICLKRPRNSLLPLAYKIFTRPELAHEVRVIEVPALAAAPALPKRRSTRSSRKAAQCDARQGWPELPDVDRVLREQIASVLEGESSNDIEAAFTAVRNGTREDLVLMLVLMNTTRLEALDIGAMGPRDDNSLTRSMFRRAAPRLNRLVSVTFGRTPEAILSLKKEEPRPDLGFSYSLFVKLFELPAICELNVFSVGPRQTWDIEDEWETFFDFIYEIKKENTTLTRLCVTEQLGVPTAHFDHVLKHCPSLEHLTFMHVSDSTTDGCGWGQYFEPVPFQKSLLCRADSLRTLELDDCLFHDTASFVDPRSKIDLRGLKNLKSIYLDGCWLFDGEDIGLEALAYDLDRNRPRLISLLPDSICELRLYIPGDGGKIDESQNAAIQALVQHHATGKGYSALRMLQINGINSDHLEMYRETFDMATAAGLSVSIRG